MSQGVIGGPDTNYSLAFWRPYIGNLPAAKIVKAKSEMTDEPATKKLKTLLPPPPPPPAISLTNNPRDVMADWFRDPKIPLGENAPNPFLGADPGKAMMKEKKKKAKAITKEFSDAMIGLATLEKDYDNATKKNKEGITPKEYAAVVNGRMAVANDYADTMKRKLEALAEEKEYVEKMKKKAVESEEKKHKRRNKTVSPPPKPRSKQQEFKIEKHRAVESIVEMFACVACDYVTSTVYQYSANPDCCHIYCNDCIDDKARFKCVRCDYGRTSTRTKIGSLRRIIQAALFFCSHEGCKAKVTLQDMDTHEAECIYGKVVCPACHLSIAEADVIKHIKEAHPAKPRPKITNEDETLPALEKESN